MRLRLLTARVLDTGESQQFGDIIEVPADEARRMVVAGLAEEIGDTAETAMLANADRGQPQARATKRMRT